MNDETEQFDYDLALSFAGEDRAIAEELASLLAKDGVRVFYDRYEKAALWGKDLYQHLQAVYRDKAKYCVVFVSAAYGRKLWTNHELRQAQARAFRERQEYILPLRLDDSEIPGLNATTGYLDMREHSVDDVREVIIQKLFGNDVDPDDLPELTWKGDLVEFRGREVASFWPAKLSREQQRATYVVKMPRIRYGEESRRFRSKYFDAKRPCGDCAAIQGEFHAERCDMEECPVCHGQALGCQCILE